MATFARCTHGWMALQYKHASKTSTAGGNAGDETKYTNQHKWKALKNSVSSGRSVGTVAMYAACCDAGHRGIYLPRASKRAARFLALGFAHFFYGAAADLSVHGTVSDFRQRMQTRRELTEK